MIEQLSPTDNNWTCTASVLARSETMQIGLASTLPLKVQ